MLYHDDALFIVYVDWVESHFALLYMFGYSLSAMVQVHVQSYLLSFLIMCVCSALLFQPCDLIIVMPLHLVYACQVNILSARKSLIIVTWKSTCTCTCQVMPAWERVHGNETCNRCLQIFFFFFFLHNFFLVIRCSQHLVLVDKLMEL